MRVSDNPSTLPRHVFVAHAAVLSQGDEISLMSDVYLVVVKMNSIRNPDN